MALTSSILSGTEIAIEPQFKEAVEKLVASARETLPTVDEDLIWRAFYVAYWAHRDGKRATGEPYIVHPLAVAQICVDRIGLDDVTVAAALLHDVVEDTEVTLEFIQDTFGDTMAEVIDGLTKIGGAFESRAIGQAENVRKLMLSMASDIRVILVKFADRLHNMRTLGSLSKHKQFKIATETHELFAPLAHRFGFNALKSELEDLSLKVLNADMYTLIEKGLRDSSKDREAYIEQFIEPVTERLKADGFEFNISGRSKNFYSIYRKMKRQNKPLSEIYDIFAIRIVLESHGKQGREDCWLVYSILTDLYKPLPERFRDFMSVPKSNGYQSLHTTVLGPGGRRVEIQIRTREMHEVAEKGVAAHWKYKEGSSRSDSEMETFLTWVRELLEGPRPEQATEFVQDFRLNLYDEEIYVFTPNGDLLTLPVGASPVDFAFQVHTEVGFHCIGSKVNGKMVPLSHKLQSGDQVEIITSKKQTPNPDWVKFVVTQKARSRVRHWINEKRRKAVDHGKELWAKRARRASIEFTEQDMSRWAVKLRFPNQQQLYYEIGTGLYDVKDLLAFVRAQSEGVAEVEGKETTSDRGAEEFETFLDTAHSTGAPALLIDGELHTDIKTSYASCCNPIPGDEVFGYISRGGVIKIHRVNCRNAPNLLINQPDRVVPVQWSRQKDVSFVTALRIMGEDRVGLVSDLTTVISKNLKTNIRSISV
ncbi:MAG: bifunctional (p)ppGpp synthetase/guanosine-3',5'-bis(diphosphate) 3'-pyrophosphohydrolase, partial [Rhodothermales bacterium]|nr:bifunctional (p)ppGpp synthetase/guanosine-3',5'-bis(diphosphate) 3'-pyrophosphohydrolase [Rhodothermales bacterium]